MAVKHVKEYYMKVTNDYLIMLKTLEELEKTITDESTQTAITNLANIRQQVLQLKENYLRLSYVMFLLNQPNRDSKKARYRKQEVKRLRAIPDEHTMSGVLKENKKILDSLQTLVTK